MIRSYRKALLGAWIVLTMFTLLQTALALPPQRTRADRIARSLLLEPNRWPWTMAKLFAESIPTRIAWSLAGQTPKTIGSFVVKRETPYAAPGHDQLWMCVASCGSGGSYAALIGDENSQYEIVWDTLAPPSVISHTIEWIDLNGNSTPEAVYHGQVLKTDAREWTILEWANGHMHLMAPRLDVPSQHLRDHRLIGDSLQILDTRDHGANRLRLWRTTPRQEWVTLQRGHRDFVFHDSINGYLPAD